MIALSARRALASVFLLSALCFSITALAQSADTDGDGVSDEQEVIDGTDPDDRGSVREDLTWNNSVTTFSGLAPWNGYLGMINVLELVNRQPTQVTARLWMHRANNSSWYYDIVSIPPNGQQDIILNDLDHFEKDSYGYLFLEFNSDADIEGRVVFYRPSAPLLSGDTGFDYAFAIPLSSWKQGELVASFNTIPPSQNPSDSQNLVANWLTLICASNCQGFVVERRGIDGALIGTYQVDVPEHGRVDIDGGHIQPGPSTVGLNIIHPPSPDTLYVAYSIRYGYDGPASSNPQNLEFATPLRAIVPNGSPLYGIAGASAGVQNWLEVVNASNENQDILVRIFDASGNAKLDLAYPLLPFAQRHFNVTEILGEGSTGSYQVIPSVKNSTIAQSMKYVRLAPQTRMQDVFTPTSSVSLGTFADGVFVNTFSAGNINGDPYEDAVIGVSQVRGTGGDYIGVFHSNGSTLLNADQLRPPTFYEDSFNLLSLIDLTGDGVAELVSSRAGRSQSRLDIFTNNGLGTLSHTYSAWETPLESATAADINSDGTLDLVHDSAGALRWQANQGNGTFSLGGLVDRFQPGYSLIEDYVTSDSALKDLNGDGLLELTYVGNSGVASNIPVSWTDLFATTPTLDGNGTSILLTGVRFAGSTEAYEVADFTADGIPDAVLVIDESPFGENYRYRRIQIANGDGLGGWIPAQDFVASPPTFLNNETEVRKVFLRDFDHDNDLDIGLCFGSCSYFGIATNDGTGFFSEAYFSPLPFISPFVLALDYNGDGLPDLGKLTSSYDGNYRSYFLDIYQNTGANPRFTNGGTIASVAGAPAVQTFNEGVAGSYNLFLGMESSLRIANVTGASQDVTVSIQPVGGQATNTNVTLAPYETRILDLGDSATFGTSPDTYGSVVVQSATPKAVVADVSRTRYNSRRGAVDIQVTLPLR